MGGGVAPSRRRAEPRKVPPRRASGHLARATAYLAGSVVLFAVARFLRDWQPPDDDDGAREPIQILAPPCTGRSEMPKAA